MLQRRRGAGLQQVHESSAGDRCTSRNSRACSPWRRTRHFAQSSRGGYQLTFGPDPATHNRCTLGGMIGTLLRRAFFVGRQNGGQRRGARGILLYDGTQITVGATHRSRTRKYHQPEGGARGAIYAKLRAIRDQYRAIWFASAFRELPRRVSGYNLDELRFPESGFNVARALVGSEGTCMVPAGGQAETDLQPATSHAGRIGIWRRISRGGPRSRNPLELNPIGLEGFEGSLVVRACWRKGRARREVASRGETGSCWWNLAPTIPRS